MAQPPTAVLTPKDVLASALGLIPSGLFVLTLRHGEKSTGLLLSWVQQCGFAPPRVTFCLKAERYQLEWLRQGAAAALHVMADGQNKPLVKHFASGFGSEEKPFASLQVLDLEHKAPRLLGALAWLELKPESFVAAGDHVLVVAEVVSGAVQDAGTPWVHIRKSGMNY